MKSPIKLSAKTADIEIPLLLTVFFIISIAVRYILAKANLFIHIYYDELIYLNISRSISENGQILVRSLPLNFKQILYPILISPAALIKNPQISYDTIKFINSVVMSSAVFPAYIIGKSITQNKKEAILISLLSVISPDLFITSLVMSESLFYPLSLWLFCFVWDYIKADGYRQKLVSAAKVIISIILLFQTKVVALYFIPAFIAVAVWDKIKKATEKQKKIFIATIVLLPLFLFFCFHLLLKTGTLTNNIYFNSLAVETIDFAKIRYIFYSMIIYSTYIIFAFLIFPVVLPIVNFSKMNEDYRKITAFTILSIIFASLIICGTICIVEDFPAKIPRIHLRYMFPIVIPLIALFLETIKIKIQNKKLLMIMSASALVMFIAFIAIPPVGDSMVDSTFFAHITHTSTQPFVNIVYPQILLKVGYFDFLKTLMLLFTVYGSYLAIKQPQKLGKILIILLTTIFILNNGILYSKNSMVINAAQNRDIVGQAAIIASYIKNNQGKTLLISKAVNSDKIMETYLNSPYFFTLLENIDRQCKNSYSIEKNGIQAIHVDRGAVYEKTHYIAGINPVFANIDYVLLGCGVNKPPPLKEKMTEITPENVSPYRLFRIEK